ncbi:MAG: Fic family protein [Beijerinckiaceae bacterium]
MASERVERRLTAILAADIAGYSRLMGADEEGTLAALKNLRKSLIEPKISQHNGRMVKTTGDGALVEFASAVDAVRCALDIQREMAERNAAIAQDRRIEFRIGINVGDIIIDEGDIYGDGVNIAARLETLARPGMICLSDNAYRHIKGKLPLVVTDMGEQQLKNIAQPVRVFSVRLDGAAARPALALPDRPSIAVLPFQNMSGDPEQDYFADGMVEDIITALSRMRWLFVIARNSSFTYKGRAVDVKQVGRELGVRYVLEGSVRKAANRVRITGQLVDAATGAHLWADRFDGALEDIFDLQDQVTASVVTAIAPKLERAEIERAKRKPTESLDAYDYYLRGLESFYIVAISDACRNLTGLSRAQRPLASLSDYDVIDDPYCYKGTFVLKNKAKIRDAERLEAFELEMSNSRAQEPLPTGKFTPQHYCKIHHHLFRDVYTWAGKPRTVRTSKGGNAFCYPEYIDREMKKLFAKLRTAAFLPGAEPVAFVTAGADFLADLNAIHPFREGNGRSQLAFLHLLGLRPRLHGAQALA